MLFLTSHISSVIRYKFLILIPFTRALYIYVTKDIKIHGYFSKAKGFRERKRLRNIAISHLSLLSVNVQLSFVAQLKVKQSRYRPGVAQRVPGS
jgi:hypothetical protein